MARPKKTKEELVPESSTEAKDQVTEIEQDDPIVVNPLVEIIPSIQVVGGSKHSLQLMFDRGHQNLPTLKSVGYAQIPGTNTYVAYTIHSKGERIIKIEVEEPNLRSIAEESAKIFFVNTFMSGDENVPG